jgi:hypothetical protein
MTKLTVIKSENLRITKPLYLREFSEDLGDDCLSIWLNVSGDFLRRWYDVNQLQDTNLALVEQLREELTAEKTPEELSEITKQVDSLAQEYMDAMFDVLADLLGCTPDDVRTIYEASLPLYQWCVRSAFGMLNEYGVTRKKAAGAR